MKTPENMIALLLLLVIGGGLFLYKNFFSRAVLVEVERVAQEALEARALYDDVNNINLDRTFLASPLVNSLINFYVMPTEQPLGRPNPFTRVSTGVSGPDTISRDIEQE